jgi:hypothetical protein
MPLGTPALPDRPRCAAQWDARRIGSNFGRSDHKKTALIPLRHLTEIHVVALTLSLEEIADAFTTVLQELAAETGTGFVECAERFAALTARKDFVLSERHVNVDIGTAGLTFELSETVFRHVASQIMERTRISRTGDSQ